MLRTEVLIDSDRQKWSVQDRGNDKLYFCGQLYYKGKWLTGEEAAGFLLKEFVSDGMNEEIYNSLLKKLNELVGQFSFIYSNNKVVLAACDKIRSIPLYYYRDDGRTIVTNYPSRFLNLKIDKNSLGYFEFQSSGYCLSNRTLVKDLFQIEAGEALLWEARELDPYEIKYFEFYSRLNKRDATIDDFNNIVNSSIDNVISIANGRTVVIPLSGGYDSRLILGKLLERGYKNIFCYTYGPTNIWEVKVVRKLVEKLKIAWRFVEFDRKLTKKTLYSSDFNDYFCFSTASSSVGHIADYLAIKILIADKLIDPSNSLIVNGQTGDFISGGHIPFSTEKYYSEDILFDYILQKHFSLDSRIKKRVNSVILPELKDTLDFLDSQVSYKTYEKFEFESRQTKYVVNGQRAYEWFNIEWYLPFWSEEMIQFWTELDICLKFNQSLYKDYCRSKNPMGVFNVRMLKYRTSLPVVPRLIFYLFKVLDKSIGTQMAKGFKRIFLDYFDKYSPYYFEKTYFRYLLFSYHHRNAVSSWVNYYLTKVA